MEKDIVFFESSQRKCAGGYDPLSRLPLASAYLPMQRWSRVYDGKMALCRGTLFPALDLPFLGKGGVCDE